MNELVSTLLKHWATALSEVIQAMAGQSTTVTWQPAPPPAPEPELLWWEQPLQLAPGMSICVAAPRGAWEHTGTITLKAAGLDTVEVVEARNTYLEILGQSLSGLARSIGGMLGREVACGAGEEMAPAVPPDAAASVSVDFGGSVVHTLWIGFSPKLIAILSLPPESRRGEERPAAPGRQEDVNEAGPAAPPRTMDLLLEVELPVSISFGKTELPMKDVLKLTTGSIVELNRGVNEPVEVLVNHCLIARGEVVVVEGNYGVRIQQIASRQDRLRSLR